MVARHCMLVGMPFVFEFSPINGIVSIEIMIKGIIFSLKIPLPAPPPLMHKSISCFKMYIIHKLFPMRKYFNDFSYRNKSRGLKCKATCINYV